MKMRFNVFDVSIPEQKDALEEIINNSDVTAPPNSKEEPRYEILNMKEEWFEATNDPLATEESLSRQRGTIVVYLRYNELEDGDELPKRPTGPGKVERINKNNL